MSVVQVGLVLLASLYWIFAEVGDLEQSIQYWSIYTKVQIKEARFTKTIWNYNPKFDIEMLAKCGVVEKHTLSAHARCPVQQVKGDVHVIARCAECIVCRSLLLELLDTDHDARSSSTHGQPEVSATLAKSITLVCVSQTRHQWHSLLPIIHRFRSSTTCLSSFPQLFPWSAYTHEDWHSCNFSTWPSPSMLCASILILHSRKNLLATSAKPAAGLISWWVIPTPSISWVPVTWEVPSSLWGKGCTMGGSTGLVECTRE